MFLQFKTKITTKQQQNVLSHHGLLSSSSFLPDFRLTCRYRGDNIHISGPLPGSWFAACMADLAPNLQVYLSWGSIAESFHSLRSLSVSCFHVVLGLPGLRFPSNCISQADSIDCTFGVFHVYIPVELSPTGWGPDPECQAVQVAHWTWWWQCFAAWHSRSGWLLPYHSPTDVGGVALSMAKSHWHRALCSAHKSCTSQVSWKRGGGKKELVAVQGVVGTH